MMDGPRIIPWKYQLVIQHDLNASLQLTVMTSAITGGWRILLKGQYSNRVNAITMEAWIMKSTIGSPGWYVAGFSPSKTPACAGALAAALAVAEAVAVPEATLDICE
jgi:hypothetical protein